MLFRNFLAYRALHKRGHLSVTEFIFPSGTADIHVIVIRNCCVQGVGEDASFESNFLYKYSSPRKSYKQFENVFLSETTQLYFFINGCHYSILMFIAEKYIFQHSFRSCIRVKHIEI